jgi:hypothetical protein
VAWARHAVTGRSLAGPDGPEADDLGEFLHGFKQGAAAGT